MQLLLKEQCTQKCNFLLLFTLLNTYDFFKEISNFIQQRCIILIKSDSEDIYNVYTFIMFIHL